MITNKAAMHTPGPWKARTATLGFAEGVFGPRINGKDRNWIADTNVGNEVEREANRNLIAAAPDMLEALDAFIGLEFYEAGMPRIIAYNSALGKARAAIKKARGQQ